MHDRVLRDHADLAGAVEALLERAPRRSEVGVPPDDEAVVAGQLEDRLLAVGDAALLRTRGPSCCRRRTGCRRRAGSRTQSLQDRGRLPLITFSVPGGRAVALQDRREHLAEDEHHAQRRGRGAPCTTSVLPASSASTPSAALERRRVLRRVDAHHAVGLADQLERAAVRLERRAIWVSYHRTVGSSQPRSMPPTSHCASRARVALGHQDVDQLVRPLSQRGVEVDHDLAADLLREAAEDAGSRGARPRARARCPRAPTAQRPTTSSVASTGLPDLERALEVERLGACRAGVPRRGRRRSSPCPRRRRRRCRAGRTSCRERLHARRDEVLLLDVARAGRRCSGRRPRGRAGRGRCSRTRSSPRGRSRLHSSATSMTARIACALSGAGR